MTKEQIYQAAIDKWGQDAQVDMVIEEMAELMQAINKYKRYPSLATEAALKGEIADVEITLEQLKIIFKADADVMRLKTAKLIKLQSKIKEQ